MPERKKKSPPNGFSKGKWDKLPIDWRNGAATKSTEELKEEIVKSAQQISTERTKMKEDDILQASIDAVKNRRKDYTDVIKAEQAKVDYVLYLLVDRGAA